VDPIFEDDDEMQQYQSVIGYRDSVSTPREVILWQAVIFNAFLDIRNSLTRTNLSEKSVNKGRALAWLDTRDFIDVCLMADVDPDFIRDRIKQRIGA
jgi:hypothetical protein